MMPPPGPLRFLLAAMLLASAAAAQLDRYELGLRLRHFERLLAASTDADRRRAAYRELDRAVQAFFRLDTSTVALALDRAEVALVGSRDDRQAFAASLQLVLEQRLHDPGVTPELPFELSAAFAASVPVPADLRVQLRLHGDDRPRADLAVGDLPARGLLDLRSAAEGDHVVEWTLIADGEVLRTRQQNLSLVFGLGERLAALEGRAAPRPDPRRGLAANTLDLWTALLTSMTRARREETMLPGARLLRDAERLAAHLEAPADAAPFFGTTRTGTDWLRVPAGKTTTIVRMLVPDGVTGPTPLVLALHGAGGSENLFFDGYGDGAIVRECERRRWFLVAPRSGLSAGTDLPGLVAALAHHWPIDPARVLLVGHSMGAAQAVAAATRPGARFAAVAALGGGGNPRRDAERLPPFFVGVGSADFALAGARGLHRALLAANAASTLREYPDVEHLAIVQIALPDVFAFFDRALEPK